MRAVPALAVPARYLSAPVVTMLLGCHMADGRGGAGWTAVAAATVDAGDILAVRHA